MARRASKPGSRWLPALLVLAFAFACSSAPGLPPRPDDAPLTEVRQVWYPGREQLKKRYSVLTTDGRTRKHGREEEWYQDGTRKAEREFAEGEPVGTWRTWHPSSLGGERESVVEIGDALELLPMTWWYPDGTVHAEGFGKGGVREGPWTYYHENGRVADTGEFRAGRRQGPWRLYYADGSPRAEGVYEEGLRVGKWQLWDESGALYVNEDRSRAKE